jgi:uncharacterized protein (DUF433 family)
MDYSKIITVEPGKRDGRPCIRGMRIAVSDVLGYLAGGMTEDEILRDFPYLTREDVRACLAYAAKLVDERPRVLPVSKATGGLLPGVDLTRLSDIQEMEDLEYIERLRKGFE